eukprot:SAG31_NODE_2403_length_5765_cov_2.260148_1_plen_97_part_00
MAGYLTLALGQVNLNLLERALSARVSSVRARLSARARSAPASRYRAYPGARVMGTAGTRARTTRGTRPYGHNIYCRSIRISSDNIYVAALNLVKGS